MVNPVSLRQGASRPLFALAAFALPCSALLGGCVETVALRGAEAPQAQVRPAANAAAVNPRGATVALASLTGVPQPLEDRMKDAFSARAGERNIALGDPAKAAYLIRAYVTAYPASTGTAVAVVYDVFDSKKKRAQRLEDGVVIGAGDADPWSRFSAAAMDDLAARSADDLAAFLMTTPEAAKEPAPGSDPGATPASRPLAHRPPAKREVAAASGSGLSVAALR
jgi:hypothetical protein